MAMELDIALHTKISEIDNKIWDSLNDGNPFTSYAYLHALEETNCLGADKGWQVNHLSLSQNGQIIGVMPLYLKYHSQGEYVFDHSWAEAFENAGGQYYPKLLCASPFTPVCSNRILAKDETAKIALLNAAKQICVQNNISSLHLNFLEKEEWILSGETGYLLRQDMQFWWNNNDYCDYDDFLSQLSSSRRKSIKRERREVLNQVQIETLIGDKITEAHFDKFYEFICDTYARKWGNVVTYLTREFFSHILQNMRDKIVLFMAKQNDEYIAGAINFLGNNILYGRQWGCIKDIPFLHFELCYNQAQEFAIKNKIKRVEAGTQGAHKLPRGYLPNPTYSSHFIVNPQFSHVISNYLEEEREKVKEYCDTIILESSPYKTTSAL